MDRHRYQRHRSRSASSAWSLLVIGMLLASLLTTAGGAAFAQQTDQAEDQGQSPAEQTAEPEVDEPTEELPQDQPTEGEPVEQPDDSPDAESQEVPIDGQSEELPPAQGLPGSVTVNVRGCPLETDLAAPDPAMLATACTGAVDAGFRLVNSASGVFLGSTTGAGGPGVAAFTSVLPGSYFLNLFPKIGQGMVVYCEGFTPHGNTKPYAQAALAGVGTPLEILSEEQISCDWYIAVDQPEAGITVIIRKMACPVGYDASIPDMYDMAATCHDNPGPITFSVFEAGGGYDGGSKPTSDSVPNQVTFTGVPNVPLWIAEQVPPAYGEPVAFCGVEDQLGNDVAPTRFYPWNAGKIELDAPGAGNVVQCDWYNIPHNNSVTVYTWKCAPGTEYRTDLLYYQGGLPDQDTGPCETEHLNIPITLTDANGPRPTPTQANGTEWHGVVPDASGQVTVAETIPDGYGDPVVFCGTLDDAAQTLVPSPGGTIVLTPASQPFDYQCNWFNVPAPESTVMIRKWECPQGQTIERTMQAYQQACTQPMDGVTFTLIDGKGPRALPTTGGQVQWTDVTTGPLQIAEEMPPGYYPNPFVACGWTAMHQGAVVDAFPQPVETINGVLNTAIQYPGTMFSCDWYNQYAGNGDVTIYKWTCPEGYDPYAWGANPKQDCTQATNGVTFVLDQPQGVDLQTDTGDSIPGAVYFGGLEPGSYTVHEMVPDGIELVFVLDCVGLNTGSVHPVPLSVGPSLQMTIAGGDTIACDWYNVPAPDPQTGWLTVTKNVCTTSTYVSDVDCEVYEGGKTFQLDAWNGSAWANVASGTTNGAGQLTWINLAPGTYRVVEQGDTPCRIDTSAADGSGNPMVHQNAGTAVKVYNCGVAPAAGTKLPTKYPNTGVDPASTSRDLPAGALFGALGFLGTASLSRRALLRRSAAATAVLGGGSLAVTAARAGQPIQSIGTPPGADCLFPATPEGVLPGTPVACARGAVPTHLRIGVIDVDADLEILEVIQGEMQQPTGAEKAAWYKESARLGERGNILIAGHLNFWGVPEGVFFRLAQLKEGDIVEVEGEGSDETFRYAVQWTENFPSDEAPPAEVLGQELDDEAITLITCGGEWITGRAEYDHRTLVRAVRELEEPEGTPAS